MNAIDLDHATIRLHDRTVLSDISLSIAEGEFIGVLGPNGSGKTTLIKALLGLIVPTHGTVRVLDASPRRGNAQIGYVPQVRTLLSDLRMRGLDLIASSLKGERWGLPMFRRADRRTIEDALAAVGAGELANRPLCEMSGGERQRLLLAQALIGSPRLLLLDEPLIGLDPRHQKNVIDHIRQFGRDHKVTVLFSAHELNQLLGSLDRVLYLGHGHAALGTVDEVVTAPVLSRLYDAEVDVIRASGHIFVMSKGSNVEQTDHLHEDLNPQRIGMVRRSIHTMLEYDFIRNALIASGIAAIVAGSTGYFLVMRGQTFAGHALSHIGFAGATGSGLIGLDPIWGMLGFTVAAGAGMGALGERISTRDVAIGVVLSLALGFGLLFLHYHTSFAAQATAILFGNILAVEPSMISTLAIMGTVNLVALSVIMRPLVFASLQPELAEAKGVPIRLVSTMFLVIVAGAVSGCAQIVGVLLVFTLMVGPPAAAQRLTSRFWSGIAMSAALALAAAWLGITLAFYSDWPVSFCISLLSALGYFASIAGTGPLFRYASHSRQAKRTDT